MATEPKLVMNTKEEVVQPTGRVRARVGEKPVGPIGIVVIMAYLVSLASFLMYSLLRFWPSSTGETQMQVSFLASQFQISLEIGLFVLVGLVGALGGLVHALRSFYWYVGNRELVWSWVTQYIVLPIVGSILGIIFYVVIRGGFFSPQATISQVSPFGFVALAGLAGLFSEQAVEKLKQVATSMLADAPKGRDYVPPREQESELEARPPEKTREG